MHDLLCFSLRRGMYGVRGRRRPVLAFRGRGAAVALGGQEQLQLQPPPPSEEMVAARVTAVIDPSSFSAQVGKGRRTKSAYLRACRRLRRVPVCEMSHEELEKLLWNLPLRRAVSYVRCTSRMSCAKETFYVYLAADERAFIVGSQENGQRKRRSSATVLYFRDSNNGSHRCDERE